MQNLCCLQQGDNCTWRTLRPMRVIGCNAVPITHSTNHLRLSGRWVSALAATDLDAALVLPSRKTFDADAPTFADVTFPDCRCDKALPAAALDALLVLELRRTPDALVLTTLDVVSPFLATTHL